MVGLPGSGKTTKAKQIEKAENALRLNADEWILKLFGHDLSRQARDAVRSPMEAQLWEIGKHILTLGGNVILDWGLWAKEERDFYKKEAEKLGAKAMIIFMDAPIEELWKRVSRREESQKGTLEITREDLESHFNYFEPPTEEELSD